MASNPPPSDLSARTDEQLIAELGDLKGRAETATTLLAELLRRHPELALREIARRTGHAYANVQRWAGRADT